MREILRALKNDKRAVTAITVIGAAGLCLIMLTTLLPESDKKKEKSTAEASVTGISEDFRTDTEKRLKEFLENIEGVGEAEVYLTVNEDEEYVYATEGKTSISENKTEEEYSYVMIGGSGEKTALIETVKAPEIEGAVIACTGSDSPVIQEIVYEAVSTALNIPTGRIYVTKLR